MLNRFARAFVTRLLTPAAALLLRLRISPDTVTVAGTLGVCFGALYFYPRHDFWWGTLFITLFVFSDLLDGTMARLSGRSSTWGAYLDSTLDRFGDAAIFGGLVMCFAGRPGAAATWAAWAALACLVVGFMVSYSRARAEGLGIDASGGIAERADRLVVILVTVGFSGLFGWPDLVVTVVMTVLALASAVTVVQRMSSVHRAARGADVA